MIRIFRSFLLDETAATAIEYALIAGSLSIVIIVGVTGIGRTLNGIFQNLSTQLK
jgi:pilus assembly protein Flp/PilA